MRKINMIKINKEKYEELGEKDINRFLNQNILIIFNIIIKEILIGIK
jgi:hypothetical protein